MVSTKVFEAFGLGSNPDRTTINFLKIINMNVIEILLNNKVKEEKTSYDKWIDSLTEEELEELALEEEADRILNEQKSFLDCKIF